MLSCSVSINLFPVRITLAPTNPSPYLTEREIGWVEKGRMTDRQTETGTERQRETDRQTDRQTDRDRDRQRQTDRQTETEIKEER